MGRWRRVATKGFVAVSASCVAFDLWNDRVLSRSLRTITAAARVAYAYKFTTPETVEELSNLNRHAAQVMLDTCLANEGLYIKFGQGISALNHVMPPEFVTTMAVCLDRAPVVPFDDIKRIVEEETGKKIGECFETFEEKPVASASIAQVHRATIRDPTTGSIHEVAVKVQKPKIRRQMWWDLTVHHFVCWALEKTFDMPVLWGQKTITETMKKEIDFIQEAANIERCAELFKDRSDLAVPKVYKEYLTERLLLTEWIQAPKLAEIPTVVEQFDSAAVLQTIVEVFGDMIFRYGFVHADPHPANVLVRPLPSSSLSQSSKTRTFAKAPHQVVLLDFGLCIEESDRFRTDFGRMFNAIFEQDFQTLDTIVKGWGIRHSELFATMMVQKPVRRDVHISADKPLTKAEVLAVQMQMKNQARELLADDKLIPRELVFVGRAMNLVRSLNKSYGAPVNRVNILADRARLARGTSTADHASGVLATLRKELRATATKFTISVIFTALRWYSAIITWLFGGSVPLSPIGDGDIDASGRIVSGSTAGRAGTQSLEDVIDAQEAKAVMRFHPHSFNINTRD